jgi:predicted O-methyltransferase YrrM
MAKLPASARRRTRRSAAPKSGQGARAHLTEAEAAAWYEGKSFSFDWTSWHFPNWIPLLAPYRRRSLRIMEIGSWEGRSALFFLNYLPRAKLTCIDTFAGGQEHQEAAARNPDEARILREVEGKFDRNTADFGPRIEKVKAPSTTALVELGLESRRFDLAYVDGGHRSSEAYADGTLTWPLMAQGGLVIFDDYQWNEMPQPLDNPGPGIDAFLKAIKGQYRVVLDDYQIGIVKL